MIVLIIVLLVIGFFTAIYTGEAMAKAEKTGEKAGEGSGGVAIVVSMASIIAASILTHYHGVGELIDTNTARLQNHAIYEMLASAPDGSGKYAVILRKDGKITCYL